MQTAIQIFANTLPQHKTKLLIGLKIQSKFLKFRSKIWKLLNGFTTSHSRSTKENC